jgi:hypothetical protein
VSGLRESATIRTGCKVVFYIEECADSLELTEDCTFEHNHALRTTDVQKAASAFSRDHLSPEQIAEAQKLQQFGRFKVAEIARFLRTAAASTGESVRWSDKDLANILAPDPVERALDAELFLDELDKARAEGTISYCFALLRPPVLRGPDSFERFRCCCCCCWAGVVSVYYVQRDVETQRLKNVVVFFREATVDHAIHGKLAIIYDHTFATNIYGLKLGTFVGQRNDKHATIYGLSFVQSEDRASFRWVLRCWSGYFGAPPAILLSDGDKWLAEAVALEYGTLYAFLFHLLCIWHLAQNVFTNVAHCFSAASKGRRGALRPGWVKMNREEACLLPCTPTGCI